MYEYKLECSIHGVYAIVESPILYEGDDGRKAPASFWSNMKMKESVLPCAKSFFNGRIGFLCDTPSKNQNGDLHISEECNNVIVSLTEKGQKALAIERQVIGVMEGHSVPNQELSQSEPPPSSEFLDNMAAINQLKGMVHIKYANGSSSGRLRLDATVFFNSEFPPFIPAIPKEITNIVNWNNVATIVIEHEEEEIKSEKSSS